VGQPRDGDPRAAYLTIDLERRFAVFRRVAYPIEKTQAQIRELGLPESLAARLATGG
jgi:diadenosine tetraphosphatase ApaH/serine/threonine PP2A family protein phosphatase